MPTEQAKADEGLPEVHDKPQPLADRLASLKSASEILEAQCKLAELQKKLTETEESTSNLLQPWWRSGRAVTSLAAIVSAIVPLTTWQQSDREQKMKRLEASFQMRSNYFDTVLKNPHREQRVLKFISMTTEDDKMKQWADAELKDITAQVKNLDGIADDRKRLYITTIGVVAKLASKDTSESDRKAAVDKFWKLYQAELLPVESPEVESLMVKIGAELNKTPSMDYAAIQRLSYELASVMKAEISADALKKSGSE